MRPLRRGSSKLNAPAGRRPKGPEPTVSDMRRRAAARAVTRSSFDCYPPAPKGRAGFSVAGLRRSGALGLPDARLVALLRLQEVPDLIAQLRRVLVAVNRHRVLGGGQIGRASCRERV